ncbi:MAG: ASKHA domain-containing protein, partial [Chloroflexota bacterium]
DDGPAITITQHDVRELQLAKSAIRAGIQALLEDQELGQDEIDQVIIAGAFGTYVDVASAVTIGMLPPLPLDRFRQVGNAAGMGAKLALISQSKRRDAETIARSVDYIELATAPGFMDTFAETSYLGRYRIEDGFREEID